MAVSARTQYILLTTLVLVVLAAPVTGLTVGLRTPPPPRGGSPLGPQLPNSTTTRTTTTSTTTTPSPTPSTTKPITAHVTEAITQSTPKPITTIVTDAPGTSSTSKSTTADVTEPPIPTIRDVTTQSPPLFQNRRSLPRDDLPSWQSDTRQYRTAAITTDAAPCSTLATNALAVGGSAVDAAIAAAICVGVVNHQSSGIGGGNFMTIYEKPRGSNTREINTIFCREWAPLAAYEDLFVDNPGASRKGGLAIGVPGEVKGLYEAWLRYGILPWEDLLAPSIQLCEEGFSVTPSLAIAVQQHEDDIRADPNLSELFLKPNDEIVVEGDILVNAKLGQTLSTISVDPESFYSGALAADIVADLAEYGSIITLEDLEGYQAKFKPPMTTYLSNGGYTAYSPRPPSSGVVYNYILNILNNYGFNPSDIGDTVSKTTAYHRIVEAYKFAYGKRSTLGDEDYVDIADILLNLTSPDYADATRLRINDTHTQDWRYYDPEFDIVEDSGTTHLSVQTRDGSAVALTATINLFFGSNVRGSRTGIMFNDEMDDFSTPGTVNSFGVPASPANYIVPRKMPLSSMCPTLVVNSEGDIVLSSGGAGGTKITTAAAFVSMQALWFGRSLLNATDAARIHHQLMPEDLDYESHLNQEVVDGLASKGHLIDSMNKVAVINSIYSTCSGSSQPTDQCLHAASDGRKGGSPDGI